MDGAPESAARASIALLSQRRRNSVKKHSGFWRDLAVRKRKTEVEPLLGKVSEAGRRAGVQTPALDVLIRLVQDVEEGRRALSQETFQVLLDVCQSQRPS
jgi:2-dehydropantoate 2-reductase